MPPRQAGLEHLPSEKRLRQPGLFSQRSDGSGDPASAHREAAEKRAMLLTVTCAERMRGNKLKKQTFRLHVKNTLTVRTLQQWMKRGFVVSILGDFQDQTV